MGKIGKIVSLRFFLYPNARRSKARSLDDREEQSKTVTSEPYVTADKMAEHLMITRRQVLEMTRKGLIPAYPLGVGEHRRVWRYKISEVETAIASGTRKP